MSDRIQSTVIRWVESLRFGWVKNTDPEDTRDIYVSHHEVPYRDGHGKKLLVGEVVEVETRLGARGPVATRVSFPPFNKAET